MASTNDIQDCTTLNENTDVQKFDRSRPGPQNVAFKPEQPKVQNARNATDNRAVKKSREYSDEPFSVKQSHT